MKIKNTKESYGAVARGLHWLTALIILGIILAGLYMTTLPNSPDKFQIYALHKSFGLLVLWLVGFRLLWRSFNEQPEAHTSHKLWERLSAKIAHLLLYIAMIAMPLSGWLMSSAGEYPVPFFGFQMPDLVGKNPDLAKLMHQTHQLLSYILIGVIGLHGLGALKHHFIDKDSTLVRMMANPMRHIGPYVLIIILGIFGFGVASLIFSKEKDTQKQVIEKLFEQKQDLSSDGGDNSWSIVQDQSRLTFRASVYDKEFTGVFPNFRGKIIFDPEDLSNSVVDITIDVQSVNSDDDGRDIQMLDGEWFDTPTFPTAHFTAKSFKEENAGNYVAIGELIIKNRSMPLILPFQLDIVEGEGNSRRAYMNASVSLNRLDFGLGLGSWKSADTVGLNVFVDLKLVAISK